MVSWYLKWGGSPKQHTCFIFTFEWCTRTKVKLHLINFQIKFIQLRLLFPCLDCRKNYCSVANIAWRGWGRPRRTQAICAVANCECFDCSSPSFRSVVYFSAKLTTVLGARVYKMPINSTISSLLRKFISCSASCIKHIHWNPFFKQRKLCKFLKQNLQCLEFN